MEEGRTRDARELIGGTVGLEGLERIQGMSRRSGDLEFGGPVRAGQLGTEYDAVSYPIFTKSGAGVIYGGVEQLGGSISSGGEGFSRGLEASSAKRNAAIDNLLTTILEERSLALSKGPSEFTGDQPAAWICPLTGTTYQKKGSCDSLILPW